MVSYQRRNGLTFYELDGYPSYTVVGTQGVLDALRASGAEVDSIGMDAGLPVHRVVLNCPRLPDGIIAQCGRRPPVVDAWLRLAGEPAWPDCHDDWSVSLDWSPCPVCNAPLAWYEAGYVPGYRICTRPPYHHCL